MINRSSGIEKLLKLGYACSRDWRVPCAQQRYISVCIAENSTVKAQAMHAALSNFTEPISFAIVHKTAANACMQAETYHEQQVVGDLARSTSDSHPDGLLPRLGERWVLLQCTRAPISTLRPANDERGVRRAKGREATILTLLVS
jgi:hypothetical protein